MRFRLTYRGPLNATRTDPQNGQTERLTKANHKQEIRKQFHPQLKELWKSEPFLRIVTAAVEVPGDPGTPNPDGGRTVIAPHQLQKPLPEVLAERYCSNGYRFVPLVRNDVHLLCGLDILFLRRDSPGGVVSAGDLDNRIKTLLDGLTMPINSGQIGKYKSPDPEEDPFFCLLEGDKLVSRLTVETDTLLDAPNTGASVVHLVITVDSRPYFTTFDNVNFL